MKITAVEIDGFWSYREHQRIDIDGIPMLVGVGENGSGKSAILCSAVLAAMYGKFPGRVITDSITEGAKRGFVAVEFELAGTKYRVTRTHPRSGAASGVVFVEDDALESGWRPVTEKGVKEVTEYVTTLLGMTADVAAMTWISAQGEHSRFADATPAARFALLSTVFGLDDYVTRAKAALDKVKGFDQAIAGVNGQITEQQDSMLLGDDVAEDADPIRTVDAAELEQRRAAAESEVVDIVVDIAALDADDPQVRVDQLTRELAAVTAARTAQLDAARAALTAATNDSEQADARHQQVIAASDARRAAATASVQRRTDAATATVERARAEAAEALALAAKADAARPNAVAHIEQLRQAVSANRAAAAQNAELANAERSARQVLIAQHAAIKVEIADCEARIVTLERSAADAAHATCFTCAQHLSPADAAALIASQRQQIATAEARKEQIATVGRQHAANADQYDAARAAAEQAEKDASTALDEAVAKLTRIDAAIAARGSVDVRLAHEEATYEAALDAARSELDEVNEAAAREVAESEDATSTAKTNAMFRKVDAENIIAEHAEPTEAERTLNAHLIEARVEAAADSTARAERRAALVERRDVARAAQRAAEAEIGRRAEIERARAAGEARLTELQTKLADLEGKRAVVAQLHAAYSPGGIPSMVLARAMRTINAQVNTVLDTLSNGRMTAELLSYREKAGGGVEPKITLSVAIDGEPRDWANLSGGQQMRVSLSLRAALTEIVSQAQAAPIKTLVLDEGFGSLDADGLRSALVALEKLADAGTQILAVSHIESVKDGIQNRVEVSRATGTSIARVVRS